MGQWDDSVGKSPDAKPNHLSSIPQMHTVEELTQKSYPLASTCVPWHTLPPCTYTYQIKTQHKKYLVFKIIPILQCQGCRWTKRFKTLFYSYKVVNKQYPIYPSIYLKRRTVTERELSGSSARQTSLWCRSVFDLQYPSLKKRKEKAKGVGWGGGVCSWSHS